MQRMTITDKKRIQKEGRKKKRKKRGLSSGEGGKVHRERVIVAKKRG